MDSKRIYNELISSAIINNGRPKSMQQKTKHECLDRHHILPRCVGGTDVKGNLVYFDTQATHPCTPPPDTHLSRC